MGRERGIRLKALRVRLGLTQKKLAEALGDVAHNTISQWETGETEPGIDNIVRLARYFNVTTDYFLCAPGADTPQWVAGGQRVDHPPEIEVAIKLLSGLRKPVRRSVVALLPGFAVSVEEKIAEARRRLEEKSITLDESGITEE